MGRHWGKGYVGGEINWLVGKTVRTDFLCRCGWRKGRFLQPRAPVLRYCLFSLRSSLRLTACKLRPRLVICVRILSML